MNLGAARKQFHENLKINVVVAIRNGLPAEEIRDGLFSAAEPIIMAIQEKEIAETASLITPATNATPLPK